VDIIVVDVASKSGGGMGGAMVSCVEASPFTFVEALADMLEYEAVICNYTGEGNSDASFRSVE
jgi:hypothetical protein